MDFEIGKSSKLFAEEQQSLKERRSEFWYFFFSIDAILLYLSFLAALLSKSFCLGRYSKEYSFLKLSLKQEPKSTIWVCEVGLCFAVQNQLDQSLPSCKGRTWFKNEGQNLSFLTPFHTRLYPYEIHCSIYASQKN